MRDKWRKKGSPPSRPLVGRGLLKLLSGLGTKVAKVVLLVGALDAVDNSEEGFGREELVLRDGVKVLLDKEVY